ncbi:hypothetical protein [Sphingomonas sp. PAMC 26605]|uniref:hypothetical protein n=1 Tax=Sphingomonas sp. PAMC 26605 TaxID=1112214 RepID=UPI00026CAC1A|nr:hypothetical protein [Sphingomonas sp. PAMC 26605]
MTNRRGFDYIGCFFFDLLLVVVVVESPGVWVDIVESVVDVVLADESGVDIAGSAVVGAEVLGDEVAGPVVEGPVVDGEDVVGAPGDAGVVCARAADESVIAAIAVMVAIRMGLSFEMT